MKNLNEYRISRANATTMYILLILFVMIAPHACSAQSTTITSKTYDLNGLSQLDTKGLNNVTYIETNSQRVLVQRKYTVTHPKSNRIIGLVANVDSYKELALSNTITDTFTLRNVESKKSLIVDNTDVDIKVEYTVYVPKHIKHFQ
jgi:hypothetical protein